MDYTIVLLGIAFYLLGAIALMGDSFRKFYHWQLSQGENIIHIIGCIIMGVVIWPVLFIAISYKNYRDK